MKICDECGKPIDSTGANDGDANYCNDSCRKSSEEKENLVQSETQIPSTENEAGLQDSLDSNSDLLLEESIEPSHIKRYLWTLGLAEVLIFISVTIASFVQGFVGSKWPLLFPLAVIFWITKERGRNPYRWTFAAILILLFAKIGALAIPFLTYTDSRRRQLADK